jgi:hypothetical protein
VPTPSGGFLQNQTTWHRRSRRDTSDAVERGLKKHQPPFMVKIYRDGSIKSPAL